jgi:hypothetical protein
MAAPVLTTTAVIMCPHGGTVAATAVAPRVLIGGAPVLTVGAPSTVQNCGLPPGEACSSVTWQAGASRVFVGGQSLLVQSGIGTCLSAAGQPTGSPLVVAVQSRASAL